MVKKYYAKDTVERAFKWMKGIFSLRPVRLWLLSHVYAHIKICYMAYAILATLQYRIRKTGISGPDALDIISRGYTVQLKDQESGLEWRAEVELSRRQEDIRNLVYTTR